MMILLYPPDHKFSVLVPCFCFSALNVFVTSHSLLFFGIVAS